MKGKLSLFKRTTAIALSVILSVVFVPTYPLGISFATRPSPAADVFELGYDFNDNVIGEFNSDYSVLTISGNDTLDTSVTWVQVAWGINNANFAPDETVAWASSDEFDIVFNSSGGAIRLATPGPSGTKNMFKYFKGNIDFGNDGEVITYKAGANDNIQSMESMFEDATEFDGSVKFDLSGFNSNSDESNVKKMFKNTAVKKVILTNQENRQGIPANGIFDGVSTLEHFEFSGLKSFTIPANTFTGNYEVTVDNNTTYHARDEEFTTVDNKSYKMVINNKTPILNSMVADIPSKSYTGLTLTPDISVTKDNTPLTENTDYTVSIVSANDISVTQAINAGTYNVTITGKGLYTGSVTKQFEVTKKTLTDNMVANIPRQAYTGNAIIPTLDITDGSKNLVKDTDYTITLQNTDGNNINNAVETGDYNVVITGVDNYTGSVTKPFKIMVLTNIATLSIDKLPKFVLGNNPSITPDIVIKHGDTTLTKDQDYTLTYTNNTQTGTGTITITGINAYNGTLSVNFEIVSHINLNDADIKIAQIPYQVVTSSSAISTPDVNITYFGNNLVKDSDYTLQYTNNVLPDNQTHIQASVTITGMGDYTGSVNKNFDMGIFIPMSEVDIANIPNQTYSGSELTPVINITHGTKTLTKDTDYTVSIVNSDGTTVTQPINAGTYNVTITGMGDYRDSVTKTFTVDKLIPTCTATLGWDKAYYKYGINNNFINPGGIETIYKLSSVTLNKNANCEGTITWNEPTVIPLPHMTYHWTFEPTDKKNIENMMVTGSITIDFEDVIDLKYASTDGDYIEVGTRFVHFIKVEDIPNQYYTGSAITPDVNITAYGVRLKKDRDYTLSYENNTDIGKATVTITGVGSYHKSITKTFNIVAQPKKRKDRNNDNSSSNNNNSSNNGSANSGNTNTNNSATGGIDEVKALNEHLERSGNNVSAAGASQSMGYNGLGAAGAGDAALFLVDTTGRTVLEILLETADVARALVDTDSTGNSYKEKFGDIETAKQTARTATSEDAIKAVDKLIEKYNSKEENNADATKRLSTLFVSLSQNDNVSSEQLLKVADKLIKTKGQSSESIKMIAQAAIRRAGRVTANSSGKVNPEDIKKATKNMNKVQASITKMAKNSGNATDSISSISKVLVIKATKKNKNGANGVYLDNLRASTVDSTGTVSDFRTLSAKNTTNTTNSKVDEYEVLDIDADSIDELLKHSVDLNVELDGMSIVVGKDLLAKIKKDGLKIKKTDLTKKQLAKLSNKVSNGKTLTFNKVYDISFKSANLDMAKLDNALKPFVIINSDEKSGAATMAVYDDKAGYWQPLSTMTIGNQFLAQAPHFSKYAVVDIDLGYDDIAGNWAEQTIKSMAVKGVMSGRTDNKFEPNSDITRAEFAVYIVNMLGINKKAKSSFVDVPKDMWYANSIGILADMGIVSGVGDNKFAPNQTISRQDIAIMLAHTYKAVYGVELTGEGKAFVDSANISDYAKSYVSTIRHNRLMGGFKDGTFKPLNKITRAETAQILSNLLGF